MIQSLNIFLRCTLLVIAMLCDASTHKANAAEDFKFAKLHFQVDPNVNFISGSVTYYFQASSTDTLQLNLSANMSIDSIVYHNQNMMGYYFAPPDFLIIPFAQTSNGLDSLTVVYHGAPATTGLGSFKQAFHAGAPIISTLSQPYGASDWMPCVDKLQDKIDSVETFITCPQAYTAVTNGVLIDSSGSNGNKVFHYKHRYPIATYLIGLAVSNYLYHEDIYSHNGISFPLLNYTYPEDDANWMNGAVQIDEAMNIFDSLFGTYPFANEHYGMLQANLGGGMEHQTITFMKEYNNEIGSHELGHHWFGNKVTCGNWHDLWINEGFATYMTGLVYESTEEGYWWPIYLKDRMNKVMLEPGGSVYITDTTNINRMFDERLTYYKAAMVLHQLRYIIGDSAFFSACRNFLNDPVHAYGFANGSDLKYYFEQSSGQDLTYYFDQWIYGEGYPVYQIQTISTGNGNFNVTIQYLTSTSTTTTFKLPVPIKFYGAQQDTTIYFPCENLTEQFTIQLPFTPAYFVCDPNYQIIAKSNAMNALRVLEDAPNMTLFPTVSSSEIYVGIFKRSTNYDILNQQMESVKTGSLVTSELNKIDISSLSNGLYYLRLQDGTDGGIKKFVKIN
jgi:aminopeptidase N